MTHRELYLWAKRELTPIADDASHEAALLCEHFFHLDRTGLALHGDETPQADTEQKFCRAVSDRKARRPLQYILGEWEFMGLTLAVGEGVLCPREDTAVLVETTARAAERIRAANPQVKLCGLDLCAGSGAAALGICSLVPGAELTCVELSSAAYPYLEKNIAAHPQYNVKAVQGDILSAEFAAQFADGGYHFIASNPPYIATNEIATLDPEVQQEPTLALDGGEDGLLFYRAICKLWVCKLCPGGTLAVEIGEEQGESVADLFRFCGLHDVTITKDWAGHDRCVSGVKKGDTQ